MSLNVVQELVGSLSLRGAIIAFMPVSGESCLPKASEDAVGLLFLVSLLLVLVLPDANVFLSRVFFCRGYQEKLTIKIGAISNLSITRYSAFGSAEGRTDVVLCFSLSATCGCYNRLWARVAHFSTGTVPKD